MAKFCIHCGAQLEEGDVFCPACGQRVTEEAPAQPVPQQTAQPAPEPPCGNCGRTLRAGNGFCTQCGAPRGASRASRPAGQNLSYTPAAKKSPLMPIVAGVLVVALVLTGLVYPGWIRSLLSNLGGNGSKPTAGGKKAGVVDLAQVDEFSDEDLDWAGYADKTDPAVLLAGDSKAFSIEPVKGITISAEENALDHDREFTVTEIDEENGERILKELADHNILMLEGWELDAGLAPNESFPGSYHVDLDLTTVEDLPSSVYENLVVIRVDDNGEYYQLPATLSGSHLTWDSSQNSFIVLGFVAGMGLVATTMTLAVEYSVAIAGALLLGATVLEAVDTWERLQFNATDLARIRFYSTGTFTIYYLVDDVPMMGRNERMEKAEKAAKEKARTLAVQWWDRDGRFEFTSFFLKERAINKKTAEICQQLLAEDAQYQSDKSSLEGPPADVLLLADQLRKAEMYLIHQGVTTPLYGTGVVFSDKITNAADTATPRWFLNHSYILVQRSQALLTMAENSEGIKAITPNKKMADEMLLTITHELLHVAQRPKFNLNDRDNLRYAELTGDYIQNEAYQYFRDETGDVTTDQPDKNRVVYEDYCLGLDNNSEDVSTDDLKFHGYTLAPFAEYLRDTTGKQVNAWQLVESYSQNGRSTSEALKAVFGLSDEGLTAAWYGYCKKMKNQFLARTEKLYPVTINGEMDGSPARVTMLNRVTLDGKTHVDLPVAPWSARLTTYTPKANADKPWAALLVRDEGMGDVMPNSKFSFRSTDGVNSKFGAFIKERKTTLFFAELQGHGATSAGGYTVYLLAQPKQPSVELKGERMEIWLPTKLSAAAEDKYIDSYVITVKAEGKTVAEETVPRDKWEDKVELKLKDMGYGGVKEEELPIFEIVIQECIEKSGKYPECRGPESEPVVLGEDNGERWFGRYEGVRRVTDLAFGDTQVKEGAWYDVDEKDGKMYMDFIEDPGVFMDYDPVTQTAHGELVAPEYIVNILDFTFTEVDGVRHLHIDFQRPYVQEVGTFDGDSVSDLRKKNGG